VNFKHLIFDILFPRLIRCCIRDSLEMARRCRNM